MYKLIFVDTYNLEEILMSLHVETAPCILLYFFPHHIYNHLTCYKIHIPLDLLVAYYLCSHTLECRLHEEGHFYLF